MPSDQLTLRGVSPELHAALEREAERRSTSMNRCAIALLSEAVGVSTAPVTTREYTDLDHLAGTWGDDELEEVRAELAPHRVPDPAMWR